jgi:hypothetical protein
MNLLKRCWEHRWIRGLAWTAVTLVTLYALLCAWVNWTGARRWSATQAMLKAEGETLDFRATMHEPIPEAENFCAIPLLKDLALAVDNDASKGAPAEQRKRLEALKLPPRNGEAVRPSLADAALARRIDLPAWAGWLPKDGSLPVPADSSDATRDVLAALTKHDAIVQELAAGLDRPKAQWTPEWKTRALPEMLSAIAVPHYPSVMGVQVTLALRATAAARAGDPTKAHETALIIARLSEASLNDPFLIGLLVAASGTSMLCSATWELCDAHVGTAEDFTGLQSALAALDFHRAALRAGRSEMAAMVDMIQKLKMRPSEVGGVFGLSSGLGGTRNTGADQLMRGVPSGFFDASTAVLAELAYRHIIKPLKEPGWQKALEAGHDLQTELIAKKERIWMRPSYILASLAVPVTSDVISRCAHTDALVKQAIIACALERHQIAHGSYPDSLDAARLADGKPLPPDPMDGKPMRYRKTADGRYALWSIGFDGKDDGGKRTLNEKKPEKTRFSDAAYVGDWVWDFPTPSLTP